MWNSWSLSLKRLFQWHTVMGWNKIKGCQGDGGEEQNKSEAAFWAAHSGIESLLKKKKSTYLSVFPSFKSSLLQFMTFPYLSGFARCGKNEIPLCLTMSTQTLLMILLSVSSIHYGDVSVAVNILLWKFDFNTHLCSQLWPQAWFSHAVFVCSWKNDSVCFHTEDIVCLAYLALGLYNISEPCDVLFKEKQRNSYCHSLWSCCT